jgi:hypothetical protein
MDAHGIMNWIKGCAFRLKLASAFSGKSFGLAFERKASPHRRLAQKCQSMLLHYPKISGKRWVLAALSACGLLSNIIATDLTPRLQ